MQLQVAPSILAADFLHLEKDIRMLNEYADIIHLDIMDGTLVPNISFGFSVIEPVSKIASIPLDAHLMIVHPENYFERCAQCGVSMLSFHLEAARKARMSPAKLLDQIRAMGIKAGLAINPDIPVSKVFRYIKHADFILIMSVFAGFGGQKFIYRTLDRVAELKAGIVRLGCNCQIEIDGGVSSQNAALLKEAGADIVVAGSSVFRSEDPVSAIDAIRRA